jgi:hypothetical protein
VTITLDRYGHLFPGSEKEAAGLLDAILEGRAGPTEVDQSGEIDAEKTCK